MKDRHRPTPQAIRHGMDHPGRQRHHRPALCHEIQPARRLLGVPSRVTYPTFMTQAHCGPWSVLKIPGFDI